MSAPRVRKHFIPLESNPEVFTELIHELGLPDSLCFQDVLSLDDAELLAFIPRPAYALVLVFPTKDGFEKKVDEEKTRLEDCEGPGPGDVVFFKQTINNACGLYAILHAACNGEARKMIKSNSVMAKLLDISRSADSDELARALEDSKELEVAYAGVARKGDTEAPANAEDEVDYHYIAFVKSPQSNHLYQLNGVHKQPMDLGALAPEEDVLTDKCLDVIRGMIASEENDLHFSLMALVEE